MRWEEAYLRFELLDSCPLISTHQYPPLLRHPELSWFWLSNLADRCANTGYECNGYCYNALARRPPSNPFSTRSTDENSRVAIPRVSSTPCQLVVQPSAGPELKNTIEHQYFTVFRESIADQLSGYYDTAIWNCVVLQACHDESWARNLVIAIGALYKSLGREGSVRERKRHYLFALRNIWGSLSAIKRPYQRIWIRLWSSMRLDIDHFLLRVSRLISATKTTQSRKPNLA